MSREHAYAYEVGYRDGSINYELEHCPACKNVADLQEALEENAKLRELVRDLAICACGKYCYGCPHQYDGCDRDERIRELGIEVDG